jgi:hypothetical protein
MELGKEASRYRAQYKAQTLPLDDFAELDNDGFVWDQNEWNWECIVVPALEEYKTIHGNLNAPLKFKIPSESNWSKGLWGIKLGNLVHSIRTGASYIRSYPERRQWLEDKGFVFDEKELRWKETMALLEQYHKVHGNLEVTNRFIVPSEDPWPATTWGKKLGNTVDGIRSRGNFVRDNPQRIQWLAEQGFRFETRKAKNQKQMDEKWKAIVKPSLVAYKTVKGNLNVPQKFVIPSGEPWPEQLWGLELGVTTDQIRCNSAYIRNHPERLQWLKDTGFVFSEYERRWEKEAKPALQKYYQVHGHMNISQLFKVPSEDPWPEEMWGYRLGNVVARIRSQGAFLRDSPERRQWLDDHGFRWVRHRQSAVERAKAAAAYYGRELTVGVAAVS